jgi:hypothetical protein
MFRRLSREISLDGSRDWLVRPSGTGRCGYPQGRVPLIEFTMATPLNGPLAGRTTGTVNPGVIWMSRYLRAGVEAIIPMDAHSGRDLGARAGPFVFPPIFPDSTPSRCSELSASLPWSASGCSSLR